MKEVRKDLNCFSCNSETTDVSSHSIFYTFLRGTGELLADLLERCLLLSELSIVPASDPVLCSKCFELFEELAVCEQKMIKLRRELWQLYKAAIIDRNDDVTNFIRGIAVQANVEEVEMEVETIAEVSDVEVDTSDVRVECNLMLDTEPQEAEVDEEEITNVVIPAEEVNTPVEPAGVEESGKWWKRRGATCKICGKWFKTKLELSEHSKAHPAPMQQPMQMLEDNEKQRKRVRRCRKCSAIFSTVLQLRAHLKCHREGDGKPPSKSAVNYKCKLCAKQFKSKAGAIYHAKTHNFQVKKNFDLKEIYRIFTGESNDGDGGFETSTVIIVEADKEQMSSDDELPLAKRRKDLLFEKVKQEVQSATSNEKLKAEPKKALEVLKKCAAVQVTKIPRAPLPVKELEINEEGEIVNSEEMKEECLEIEEDGEVFMTEEDYQMKLSSSDSKHDQRLIHSDSDVKEELDPDDVAASLTAPRQRGRPRTRKMPLTTLLKIKERKQSGVLPVMKEPRFKCDICDKLWKTRGELNAHRATHSDARPYICEMCGQAYKHKPALDVHVGMHRGIYQHQCPYCKKAFTQKGALQRHLPIHTGDLPYQCELCGKRFVHRTSFSIHSMAHTGVRNIRCEICNMGVLSKSHLRRHMRIHSGEKPYDCQTCGKAFAERYNLVAHQRIHDPNQTGPARTQKRKPQCCRLCSAVFDRRHKLEDHMVAAHNKIVEESQPQRNSVFESAEAFLSQRFLSPESTVTVTKNEVSDVVQDIVKREEPPSVDLSMRGVHTIRNIDLLRNTIETPRGLELLRMANGMTESSHSWGYINPAT